MTRHITKIKSIDKKVLNQREKVNLYSRLEFVIGRSVRGFSE